MKTEDKSDVIHSILSGEDDAISPEAEALDYLIYRETPPSSERDQLETDNGGSAEMLKKNLAIEVWESKAKIRVRAAFGAKRSALTHRIAKVAMNAIIEDLRKEEK